MTFTVYQRNQIPYKQLPRRFLPALRIDEDGLSSSPRRFLSRDVTEARTFGYEIWRVRSGALDCARNNDNSRVIDESRESSAYFLRAVHVHMCASAFSSRGYVMSERTPVSFVRLRDRRPDRTGPDTPDRSLGAIRRANLPKFLSSESLCANKGSLSQGFFRFSKRCDASTPSWFYCSRSAD